MNRILTFVLVSAFLINRGIRIKNMVSVYPDMKFNDQNCQIKGSMIGSEDMCLGKNSLLFAGSTGGLDVCFNQGSQAAENGGVWTLDMKNQDAQPKQLQLKGYPHQSIHVHGIYVSNSTDHLYAINHLGPESTVEVFKIDYSTPVSLTYLQTIESDLFPRYGINDVIEGINDNEIYVTRWNAFSIPEAGKFNPATLVERIQNSLLFPIVALLGLTLTKVYRCDLAQNSCEDATDRIFVGANGITKALDGITYYTVDLSEKRIAILKRQSDGWLELDSWIQLPFALDNVEFDQASGNLMAGTMPDLVTAVRRLDGEDVAVPGGFSLVYLEYGEWKTKDMIYHDGTKLSQVSGANMFGSIAVLSSPVAQGLLVCNL